MNALPQPPFNQQPPDKRAGRRVRPGRWKGILGWIATGVGVLNVLLVIAVVVLLHSASFHQYLLRIAQEKATTALGTQVQARDFALHWSGISPTIDLYDVAVHGSAPYQNSPLLQVDHIGVQVKVTSILRRTWYLNDLTFDHPVARVFVDQHGTDNLPHSKSTGQSQTSVFDLGVRHALLDRGEVYYNDQKSTLDADLLDVQFQSAFDTAQRQYSGNLSYRNGKLQFGAFQPIPHNLQAQFKADPNTFTLERAVLTSGGSRFLLTATLQDYSNPRLDGKYDALLDAGEFRRITRNPSLPIGVIRLAGTMQYQSASGVPIINAVTLRGDLTSPALRIQTGGFRGDIRDLGVHYDLDSGSLNVRDLRARVLGGELTGNASMRDISGATHSRLRASVRGVSLAELRTVMNSSALQQVALAGILNADADANWGKTLTDLVASTNATIQASVGPQSAAKAGAPASVPVNSAIHARYVAASKQISLANSYLRTPNTSLGLNGTVSDRSSLQVQLRSNDLHELETVADMFRTATPGQPVQPLGLYGTASFTGAVRGSTAAPDVTGQLTAANLRLRGSAWRVMRANVTLNPSLVSLQNGYLQPVDRGQIAFTLRAALRKWSYTASSPVQLSLHASQLNVADLAKAAGTQTPVSGTLSANLVAHGSQLNPVGQGQITLSQAKISDEPIQSLNLNFQGTGDRLTANLAMRMPAGAAQGALTYYPKQQGYDAKLQANGIRLDRLQTVKQRNLQLSGVLNVNATGSGTVKDPGLQATAQIPQLVVHGQTISGITLQTAVANHVAKVALDSAVMNITVHGRGTINLTGNYDTDATFDTQAIPLQPLVAAYAPSQGSNISGQTELHGTLRGPLKNKTQLDAHLTIVTLQVKYKDAVQIGAVNPIHIDYTNGVLALQRTNIRGTGTDLQLQGTVPTASTQPMSLLLLGTVDLQLAQLFDPDISSSGQLRFNINSYGQRTDPNVQGQVQVVNANFATGDVPIGLQNGNGVLTLTKDRLNITQFQGLVGGGTVTAQGGVVYRPALQFDLALAGKGMRFIYPDGVREGIDTNLLLTGNPSEATLRGQVRLNQLQFTPDFDLTNFMTQFSGETTPPPAQGFSQNLQLDVAVQSTNGVNLVSRTLSLQAIANLRVTGTAAQPVILGRVNLNGGDLIFHGDRFVLEGGTIDFINPSQTQPFVNVAVNTTIDQYNIHLRFDGSVDQLHTNYSSDPALPPADIINLIAFGKTMEASAANPAVPGNVGAESLIASQVSSQVTNRVEKIAGISQLSVDPVLGGGNQQNPGARVTIQQRVTSNLFVTFASDVTSTQRQTIEVQYKVSPRVSVSATRDQNGGFGFDTRIKKTW